MDRDRETGTYDASPGAVVRVIRTEVLALGEADLAEIHDVRTRSSDFFREVGDRRPTPASFRADLDDLPGGFARADEIIYRAYDDGRLAGYAEVLRGFAAPDQWMIGIVLVDAEQRGRGVGKAIVAAIAADAAQAGASSLAAGVIVARGRSLSFWRREGFTKEAHRRPIVVGGVETEVVRLERPL